MSNEDKMMTIMVENNTNIKHLMVQHKEMDKKIDKNSERIFNVENVGKKTVKEHLISFSKVCGAFLVIGAGFTGLIKLVGKLWL